MSNTVELIRDKIASGQFEFSEHATGQSETMIERTVAYILEVDGGFVIIENVPARVCLETGERFFSPETVERLQQIAWKRTKPSRFVETPVFEFAA